MAHSPSVTIPAFAADTLHETITLYAPVAWHDRIRALAPRCCYGPRYSRYVLETLREMSDNVRTGYSTLGYDRLVQAEALARR